MPALGARWRGVSKAATGGVVLLKRAAALKTPGRAFADTRPVKQLPRNNGIVEQPSSRRCHQGFYPLAEGSMAEPGTNVAQKSGLNRAISNVG